MRIDTFTINPFAFLWMSISVILVLQGEINWWIPTLIFLSHVELNIKFPLR